MPRKYWAAFAAAAIGVAAASASADIIAIQGSPGNSEGGLGNFAGTIEYEFQSGNSGLLVISLTNTSDPGNGGFLTAFVFNIGAPQRTGTDTATLFSSTYPAIVNIPGPGIGGSPFGHFDAGAGLGGEFLGGGTPSDGIAVGDTGVFEFTVDSAFASVLTASSFISGPNEFNFVVRFRGFLDGGSDKVPVPAPGALALLGLGALAMGSRRRIR